MLGAVNAILYFALGAGGVVVPAHLWLMLYVDAAALQLGLYFYNRRHNVSPHEKKGSAGVAGHADLGAVGADLRGLARRGGDAPHAAAS